MGTTNHLLLLILVVLLWKFFPGETTSLAGVVLAVGLYGCYWLFSRLPGWRRARRADKLQTEQDERDFWEWTKKHNAIRAKFDPEDRWNEATTPPPEYRREILELNTQYRVMLQRRNGWSQNDFLDIDA